MYLCSNKLVILNGRKTTRTNSGQMIHDYSNNGLLKRLFKIPFQSMLRVKIHYHLLSQYITVCEEQCCCCCCLSSFCEWVGCVANSFEFFSLLNNTTYVNFVQIQTPKALSKTICSLSVFVCEPSVTDYFINSMLQVWIVSSEFSSEKNTQLVQFLWEILLSSFREWNFCLIKT